MLSLFNEIEGKLTFQNNIILQTLNSKRLLIDHVEILEECLSTLGTPVSGSATFSAPKLLALTSIGAACAKLILSHDQKPPRWSLPILALTASTYATCCTLKWTNRIRFQRQETSLGALIYSLDRFEAAIRRNLLFLNESQHGRKVNSTTSTDCFAGNCVRVCVATVRCVHGAVKRLEEDFELDERWSVVYVPMEALEDCELFAEEFGEVRGAAGLRTIKDLYNIYAYVQSQYLTRLALAVTCGMTDLRACKLTELASRIDVLRDDCMKYLDKITETKKEVIPRPVTNSLPPEVANLRSLSTALSIKMLKTAHRYNQLEELLQESTESYEEPTFVKQLSTLELSLEEIANDLAASDEECQRLLILVKKLSNKETDPLPQLQQPEPEDTNQPPVFSEQYQPPQKDEFFAVDGTDGNMSDDDDGTRSVDSELENIDSKIVKRHFRPVLQQLRERIEPIGVEFREREKRALQDKGIDLDEDEEQVPLRNTLYGSSDSEDEESDGGGRKKERKFQRSVERYDDVRGFLAAKEQMSIFGMVPTMASVMDEEVLE